ncbi:enoyl-CoA hydratase/isomerase family protein [Pedobacter changchengzhani]|uniref:Enoyl-CoA hydratase/isomerase family protein n=1 Tax=Pedobacter changchengzhani TaxID=2529274 RepID=A0A4R5MN08_9SPHI|nr:enoyl-CoA hydratase/isomerase family protein [Pedobacter changchengzhani]TDG37181.1 enoyl-CoA hydratase/isomerase family protein [Pedobacter changchengzhani]
MNTIKVSVTDRLATITLSRGKSNPLNTELLTELNDMLENISNDENIGGVILTGNSPFFSAGLDLIELYDYDEKELKTFFELFFKFTADLVAFKKPIIAAISGHSPAGGCVMALACDYRIMAEGQFIIGLNEVPVGIIVPNSIFKLYSFWIGNAEASRSLLTGKLYNPEEALAVGLIDEIVKNESLLTAATRKIKKYMELESNTWSQSKLNIREDLIRDLSADQSKTLEKMLVQWWSPKTRHILKVIIASLQRK